VSAMNDETADGFLLARIVIERHLDADTDRVDYTALDAAGNTLPLIEQLGLLAMAQDSARELAAQKDNDDD